MANIDKSCWNVKAGDLGRLNVLNLMPVFPGDRVDYQSQIDFRMSPMHRQLTVPAQVDIFTAYQPAWQIYNNGDGGKYWADWLQSEGENHHLPRMSMSAQTVTGGGSTARSWGHLKAMPFPTRTYGTSEIWPYVLYCNTWNRYCRPLRQGIDERPAGKLTAGTWAISRWAPGIDAPDSNGFPVRRLPMLWNIGHEENLHLEGDGSAANPTGATQFNVVQKLPDPVERSYINMIDFDKARADYDREFTDEYLAEFYTDHIRQRWGMDLGATSGVDPRPLILSHDIYHTDGFNIESTDFGSSESPSQIEGRNQTLMQHGMGSRWMAPEHGYLMTFLCVRFPQIWAHEHPWWLRSPQANRYINAAGDPLRQSKEPNYKLRELDITGLDNQTRHFGWIPHGEWHRYQPNMCDEYYSRETGFPIQKEFFGAGDTELLPSTVLDNSSEELASVFKLQGLQRQFQTFSRFHCTVNTRQPGSFANLTVGGAK